MDSILTMMWRDLPPVGNSIAVSSSSTTALPCLAGFTAAWVNSGTAALALALLIARQKHPEVSAPEVIIPGYACPDLVSAAIHADVHPVLADTGADDPGYDLTAMCTALTPNTVAVVAVNFLGIRDRLREVRAALAERPGVALIEDNAQWFPESLRPTQFSADALCFSFGRGKPISLLGGGALFVRDDVFLKKGSMPNLEAAASPVGLSGKMRAYNLLLNPWLYGLARRNPLLNVGRTRFKPLQRLTAMDEQRLRLLPQNVEHYLSAKQVAAQRLNQLLPPQMNLPALLRHRSGRLLRYPLLCSNVRQRDALWKKLLRAGLGASTMYQKILPEITGVGSKVIVRQNLQGASQFAQRLLTLPVHEGVDSGNMDRMLNVLATES